VHRIHSGRLESKSHIVFSAVIASGARSAISSSIFCQHLLISV